MVNGLCLVIWMLFTLVLLVRLHLHHSVTLAVKTINIITQMKSVVFIVVVSSLLYLSFLKFEAASEVIIPLTAKICIILRLTREEEGNTTFVMCLDKVAVDMSVF